MMVLKINPEGIPPLPRNIGIFYLNEGAANIVFRLSVRYPTPEPSIFEEYGESSPPPSIVEVYDEKGGETLAVNLDVFEGKLLRLRKDVDTAPTSEVSQAAYHRLIEPLFDHNDLVVQELVKIAPINLINRLNDELKLMEEDSTKFNSMGFAGFPRKMERRGLYLAQDPYGLLITDMSPLSTGLSSIEFKPKWLAQSPSAPANSVRCRQCAYTACENAQLSRKKERLRTTWCPLGLVSDDAEVVMAIAAKLLRSHNRPEPPKEEVKPLAEWIKNSSLLRRLRDNQLALDKLGPLQADAANEKFRLAMTLRDVSLFLRFPESTKQYSTTWEGRLGDLDIKSADKAAGWKKKEEELIKGGWYTGEEAKADQQPVICYLNRLDH